MKHWEKNATPYKEILVNISHCVESLYMNKKEKALKGMAQVKVNIENFDLFFERDLLQEE